MGHQFSVPWTLNGSVLRTPNLVSILGQTLDTNLQRTSIFYSVIVVVKQVTAYLTSGTRQTNTTE